jgi:large subunit ribosomal protein L3e
MGYKAGMTHCVKYFERRDGKKLLKKDVVHSASVVETPPMKIIGMVGYIETPRGLRTFRHVWANKLDNNVKRRFYKNWYAAKKKAFETGYQKKIEKKVVDREIQQMKKYCTTIRVLAATQIHLLKFRQRKAHFMEIQLNGGSIAEKIDWARSKFEQEVTVGEVFEDNECIDTVGVTKGKGTQGVIKRFCVNRLPRKTHRGLRKVGCIGAWHPAAVKWTVGRSGQMGYHSRTELNKKIYRVGAGAVRGVKNNAMTANDAIEKNITPMGGFPHYGLVKEDYLLIKGQIMGTKKRVLTLRKSIFPTTRNWMNEDVDVKFIDTASHIGHGRFQTLEEKDKFLGPLAHKLAKKESSA